MKIKKRVNALRDNLLNPFSEEATKQRIIRLLCNEYMRADIKLSPMEWMKAFAELSEVKDEKQVKVYKETITREVEDIYESAKRDTYSDN